MIAKSFVKWLMRFTVILMLVNAVMDYKDGEFLSAGLALTAAIFGFMSLVIDRPKSNNN